MYLLHIEARLSFEMASVVPFSVSWLLLIQFVTDAKFVQVSLLVLTRLKNCIGLCLCKIVFRSLRLF